jgi:hypothetical protein
MTDYVTTFCTVTGPERDISTFEQVHIVPSTNGEPHFDFETVGPIPTSPWAPTVEVFERRERSEGRLAFTFTNSWSFPLWIFTKLAALYPELVFNVAHYDEINNFACSGGGQFNGDNDYRARSAQLEADLETKNLLRGRGGSEQMITTDLEPERWPTIEAPTAWNDDAGDCSRLSSALLFSGKPSCLLHVWAFAVKWVDDDGNTVERRRGVRQVADTEHDWVREQYAQLSSAFSQNEPWCEIQVQDRHYVLFAGPAS